jgi:hypothetical protein
MFNENQTAEVSAMTKPEFTPNPKFKRLGESINLPAYSFKKRTVGYLKFISEIILATDPVQIEGQPKKKKKADTVRAIDLETGEMVQLIMPKALVGTFLENRIDYQGKCWEIHVTADTLPGKEYKGVKVYPCADPTEKTA